MKLKKKKKRLFGTARMTPRPTKGKMRVGGFAERIEKQEANPTEDVESALRGTGELKAFPSYEIEPFRRGVHRESALDPGRAAWLGKYGVEVFRNPSPDPSESPWIVSLGGMKNIWVGWQTPMYAVGFATGLVRFMEEERKDALRTKKETR